MFSLLTYCSFILDSWSESFPGNEIPPNIYGFNQVDQYKTIIAGNFYISHVRFITVKETEGKGGAICVNTATNLLIESSSFIKCHSKGEGGAIYFSDANGKSVLKKVCSTSSYSSTSHNYFCVISTKSSDKCTNCMEHSSVADLKSTTNCCNNVYFIGSDIIILKYNNISKNQCSSYSASLCRPSISSSISYTSYENNTATVTDVIYLGDNKHDINKCNVIGNVANSRAIIDVAGSVKISNSCLIENTNPMFVYSGGSSSCTIISCTIDNTDKHGGGSVTVDSNNIPPKSFINNLNNNGCFSVDDSNRKFACPTFNMRQHKCNMEEKRLIHIVAKI